MATTLMKNQEANAALQKALLDTSAASTGDVLIPDVVEPTIRRYIETETPLFDMANPRSWPTNVYKFRFQDNLPRGEFRADGGTLPAPQRPNYGRGSVEMKYLYIRGEVTGPLIAASGGFGNAFELSVEASGMGMAQTLEEKFLTGDESANPDEFDGYLRQVTNTFTPAGATAAAPATLTLAMLDEALDAGSNDVVVLSKAMGRRVWGILQAQQRFVNDNEVEAGFVVTRYQGRPIVRVASDGANTALANTILMLNRRLLTIPILKDVTYSDLAKVRDSRDYMLSMYLTLAVEGTAFKNHVKVVNVRHNV